MPRAAAGSGNESRDVHELHDGRGDLLRVVHLRQDLEPFVRDFDHGGVWFHRAEGIGRDPGAGACQGIEQGGLAHVGKANDSNAERHRRWPGCVVKRNILVNPESMGRF